MISEAVRAQVRTRASHRCEYCLRDGDDSMLVPLQIEHIIPRKHGGTDDLDNLAIACVRCNLHKGSNLTGIDPHDGKIQALFHPRRQRWSDHFRLDGPYIVGKTAIGRTTARVLEMNSSEQILRRSS